MPVLMIADISLTTFLLISPSRPFVSFPRSTAFSNASTVHLRAVFSVLFVLLTRRTPSKMFIVCRPVSPGEFKLLSSRHGSTAEVGFIQVCVQNDASSAAHYNALILGGLYRGREGKEEKDRGRGGHEQKKKRCRNKGRGAGGRR